MVELTVVCSDNVMVVLREGCSADWLVASLVVAMVDPWVARLVLW